MDLISNLQTTLTVAYTHDTTTKFTIDSVTNWPADGVVRVDDAVEWALQRYDLLTVGPPKELDTLTDPKAIFESSGAEGHEFAIGTTVTLVFTGDYLDELVPGTPLLADGTVPLTANWDAGAFQIRALTFYSDIATGTAPLTVLSTTVVPNLNADLVDGHHFADAILAAGTVPLTAAWDAGPWQIRAETFRSDVVTGTAPLTVASTTKVVNLNADLLDGAEAASWILADGTTALTGSWDAGAFQIRALTFYSDVATGTAPFTVASTTMVANLNADSLDGKEATDVVLCDGTQPLTGDWDAGAFELTIATIDLTGGQIAFPAGAVPSADPNTIDDYEEGYFTVTLVCGTGGTVTVAAAADTFAYTRIGRKVFIGGQLTVDAVNAPVGSLTLNTLPFAVIGGLTDLSERATFAIRHSNVNALGGTSMTTYTQEGLTGIVIEEQTTIGTAVGADHMKATTTLYVSGHYMGA